MSVPGADRGPRAGSPRGVVVATGFSGHFDLKIMLLLLLQGAGGFGFLIPMLLVFGVFYLLLIRPQQKKQRQLQAQIADLKAGDKIVTTGGIIGTITAVKDTSFLVRSADKTILEIARSAVAGVDSEEKK